MILIGTIWKSLANKNNYRCLMLLLILIASSHLVSSNPDSQCCRKKIECFECDSRYDARCEDGFVRNITDSFIHCDDLCVKLKHVVNQKTYYIRTCADTIKNIQIKKTDVCYTSKEGGFLCFCDQDRCNHAAPLHHRAANLIKSLVSLSVTILLLGKARN